MPRTFTPVPNRKCTVSIQVIGCAGLSEAVNAKGYCVGKPAAPDAIAKPIAFFDVTDINGIRKITVTKPDDSNGLLSCLFIIVNDKSSGENTHFRMENLIKAQSSTTEYIAVALPVYRFTGDRKVVNLGDSSGASCNVTQTIDALSKKRRRRRNVGENAIFVGQNRKLNKEKSYSVFIVSTTPCENEICLRTSPSILLKIVRVQHRQFCDWFSYSIGVLRSLCLSHIQTDQEDKEVEENCRSERAQLRNYTRKR
ncbi:uncharacterized protein LOC120334900 [Styela clava]